MRKIMLISVVGFLSIFLISCTTIKEFTKRLEMTAESIKEKRQGNAEQKEEFEYGKLVFMGEECVAWFSPDLNIIGPKDMEEYFQKNNIEPIESKILAHFTSLGWEVVEKTQKDTQTTEIQLKRVKIHNEMND